jgi:ethanolamine utilization protein EutN
MFLGLVKGTVVATRKTPSLNAATLKIVLPVNHRLEPSASLLVAVDTMASREGDLVYLVKGREATMPWKHDLAPIDATIVGLVDGL